MVAAFLSMVQMPLPGVFTLTVIVVFRLVLRLDVLAVVAFVTVCTYIGSDSGETIWSLAALTAIQLTAATVALRFGLLARLMCNVTRNFLTRFPVTFDTGEWYFSSGLIGMGIPLFTSLRLSLLPGEKNRHYAWAPSPLSNPQLKSAAYEWPTSESGGRDGPAEDAPINRWFHRWHPGVVNTSRGQSVAAETRSTK